MRICLWCDGVIENEDRRRTMHKACREEWRAYHEVREINGTERPRYFHYRIVSQVMERDGYTCKECGVTKRSLEVHHIKPLSEGGTNALENLITLCPTCHKRKHSHDENVRRRHIPLEEFLHD